MAKKAKADGFLRNARVYLSGPMDFVASRAEEKKAGWRVRVKAFLESLGAVVFDPWSKPRVRGLHEYGREDVATVKVRENWTFEATTKGARRRAQCAALFWETMHIDLRMVDISDMVVAYCPTNVYSVGTPHEIIVARQQHKPVLLVSPPVVYHVLDQLTAHLSDQRDPRGLMLVEELQREVPMKSNPRGVPGLWYMPLIGGHNFFDGFGFEPYREAFEWADGPLDERERRYPPHRPVLRFLDRLNRTLPRRWSIAKRRFVREDDWLLMDLPH